MQIILFITYSKISPKAAAGKMVALLIFFINKGDLGGMCLGYWAKIVKQKHRGKSGHR